MTPDHARDRLIVALDLPGIEAARAMVERLGDSVTFYKIGKELVYAGGLGLAAELIGAGKKVFLDLKLHDIPNTVAGAMQAIHVLEPAIVTVHASGGRAMMEDAKAAAGENCKVVGVTLLTSLDEDDMAATGIGGTAHDQVIRLAELSRDAGLDGIVCSGHEVAAVHSMWKSGFLVVPGLRPADAKLGDQKRAVTPRQARDAGASVLVIGRPIARAEDPAAAARAIEATL